ncbi:isochorismatase [Cupriavidus sp. RAF12]|uniref:isochorismatase n=1 Tax=Cupriavidus sp. RAF12 TaxID=3233050 RepID=UPI003F924C65
MNAIPSPYTVAVYPIEQQPGVWFAAYLISEYKDGTERVLANVVMRHDTHRSAAKAKQAARSAGERAIARLATRPHHPGVSAHAYQGARHG